MSDTGSGPDLLNELAYEFAERLFDMTRLGMRVVVAPADVAPVTIVHPALFQPKTDAAQPRAPEQPKRRRRPKRPMRRDSPCSKPHEKQHRRWCRYGLQKI